MITEGWVHDEGPYGEFTGMYGGGLKHNPRVVIHCMTYRKGRHLPARDHRRRATRATPTTWCSCRRSRATCSTALRPAASTCWTCAAPRRGCPTSPMRRIKPHGGGDAKQALAIMLTCSKQGLPKIAMVFDEDVDIWDDNRIAQCMAFRYMPDRDTIIIPQCNTMSTDPKVGDADKPFYASKIGLDCTIPLVGRLGPPRASTGRRPATSATRRPSVKPMTEAGDGRGHGGVHQGSAAAAGRRSSRSTTASPTRSSTAPSGGCATQLGRAGDSPWFRYTFADHDFAFEPPPAARAELRPAARQRLNGAAGPNQALCT